MIQFVSPFANRKNSEFFGGGKWPWENCPNSWILAGKAGFTPIESALFQPEGCKEGCIVKRQSFNIITYEKTPHRARLGGFAGRLQHQ